MSIFYGFIEIETRWASAHDESNNSRTAINIKSIRAIKEFWITKEKSITQIMVNDGPSLYTNVCYDELLEMIKQNIKIGNDNIKESAWLSDALKNGFR